MWLSRKRKLELAVGATCLAAGLALSAPALKESLKAAPGYTLATVLLYNAMHEPLRPTAAGDGGPAKHILLDNPGGLAIDSRQNVYIGDRSGFIWKVDVDGTARIIAGTGRRGLIHAGARAIDSDLGSPEGLAFDSQDRLHFVDSVNNAVFRLEDDGTLTRIAGDGRVGHGGDGGPAIEASLYRPFDIRFDSEDILYIVDVGNHRIRRVDPQGRISTVAGNGTPGYSGDGGPAVDAQLREPYGAYLDAHDRLYIADSGNNVVRLVASDGTIRTIAGGTERGFAGDGGPAALARFDSPQFLVVDDWGRIYVGDEHNNSIRMIARDGTIATLIGNQRTSAADDATAASELALNDPEALVVLPDGTLLIVDGDNGRVIRFGPDAMPELFAGGGPEYSFDIKASGPVSETAVTVR